MAKRFNPGVVAQKGKVRTLWKRPPSKKSKEYQQTKYVRRGRALPPCGTRMDRAKWKRGIGELLAASNKKIVKMLEQDGLLPKWSGHLCRRLYTQQSTKVFPSTSAAPKLVGPWSCQLSKGKQHQRLQVQAALLLLLLTGASHGQCRLLLQVNHKMIEGVSSRLQVLRQSYAQEEEKKIVFGDGKKWIDVEADEATFDRADATRDVTYKDSVAKGKPILWEQWSGILVRGNPKSLLLTRFTPAFSVKRAPGPGAIHKVDWAPLAQKHFAGRKIILRADAAKSYRAKVKGVLHDAVVHCKKKRVVRGKVIWVAPQYARVTTHKVAKNKTLKVKSGTQRIDRAWRFLKERVRRNQQVRAGAKAIRARIRAAQYEYWFRGHDVWVCAGHLVMKRVAAYMYKN